MAPSSTKLNITFATVLKVALPLVLANSCRAINMFIDRLMLARYSQDAVAAAFTGGLTQFAVSCLLVGLIGYVSTFVAQYAGAQQEEQIGRSVWQGIWLGIAGSLILYSGLYWSSPLFHAFNHTPGITAGEIQYFNILMLGSPIFLTSLSLSCFWTGRSKTMLVMLISTIATLCNIPINYLLIYGKFGAPELGVAGAAWGTIAAEGIGMLVYLFLFLRPNNRRVYHTNNIRFDFQLLRRMIKFGLPSGVQLILDLVSFTTFGILMGCYGAAVQEGASIAFGINNLAFCPVLGISQAAAVLVGQGVGAEDIPSARKAVKNSLFVGMAYSVIMILVFTLAQELVLGPFRRPGDELQIEAMHAAKVMLYFIAAYLFIDGFGIILSNAIRGAGDTSFCMWTMGICGILFFALPCFVLYKLGFSWIILWINYDLYVVLLAAIFSLRYRTGKWTKMKVIS
jgi:multidrug resistance protein, MATE family